MKENCITYSQRKISKESAVKNVALYTEMGWARPGPGGPITVRVGPGRSRVGPGRAGSAKVGPKLVSGYT